MTPSSDGRMTPGSEGRTTRPAEDSAEQSSERGKSLLVRGARSWPDGRLVDVRIVNGIVEDMSKIIRRLLGDNIRVETALDSLGFDTEIVTDPVLRTFMVLMVRNPFRLTAHAMAYMYWFRGTQLREQAIELDGGFSPQMRAPSSLVRQRMPWSVLK